MENSTPRDDRQCIFQSLFEEVEAPPKFETPKKRKFRYNSIDEQDDPTDTDLITSFSSWDFGTMGNEEIKCLALTIQGIHSKLNQFQLTVGDAVDLLTNVSKPLLVCHLLKVCQTFWMSVLPFGK